MLKSEYIKDFAFRTNLSQKQAKKILESVYAHLIETLIDKEEVFCSIGKFYIKQDYVSSRHWKGYQNSIMLNLNDQERSRLNDSNKK